VIFRPAVKKRSASFLAAMLLISAPRLRAQTLRIGDAAPDVRSITLDGKPFSLEQAVHEHDAVVVMFLSTVCPYSNLHSERIRDLARELAPKGVLFVGINSNRTESAEEMVSYAHAHGHTFPLIKDLGNSIADRFGARLTPEVFVLDRASRLRYHGRIESKYRSPDLRNALDAILAGKPVRLAEAKAFGCAITRE
jgi:peroxiredoxin